MLLRLLVFVIVALVAYVATVAAAFVFWSITGASGTDYTPLLFVLFALAPAMALTAGTLAIRRRRKPEPQDPDGRGPAFGRGGVAPPPARRNGPLQYAIAIGGALLVGALMLWLGDTPNFIYIPR